MTKQQIFIDLDDTLANFNEQENALQRFTTEQGFFKNLRPTKLVNRIKKLPYQDFYILSTSPNKQADIDKREWVAKHLPLIPSHHIILVRDNSQKAIYANGNLLIDDHTPNLIDWVANGGYGIKVINHFNNKNGTHKRKNIQAIKI